VLWLVALVLVAAPAARRVTDDQGCDKGLDANNELDGEIVCKTPQGIKRYEGTYSHGKRVGLAKTWRDNGKLGSVDRYVDGKRSGLCEDYDVEGVLKEACEYKADQKHGPCKRFWFPGGKLSEELLYVDGQQRGRYTRYYPKCTRKAPSATAAVRTGSSSASGKTGRRSRPSRTSRASVTA
jgi:hypothetical protein